MPRGLLGVAGASIARHQLALALALKCEKVIALARGLSPGMLALQHEAERAGAQFHAVSSVRQLPALITAADDVVVLADGLIVDNDVLARLLDERQSVLVQPIETGLAAGFERIDINHAAAGAMRIPGHTVDRLNELPPDCDAVSALTRIALQSGVPQQAIPDSALSRSLWRLVRSDDDAQRIESEWIGARLATAGSGALTARLSRILVRQFAGALLNAGNGALSLIAAAGLCLLLALVAGWFGVAWLAFALVGVGTLLRHCAAMLRRLDVGAGEHKAVARRELLLDWLADGVIVAAAAWTQPSHDWRALLASAFAPAMLILTLRLVTVIAGAEQPLGAWLGDRLVLAIVLAGLALAGWLAGGIMVLCIAAAMIGLLGARLVNRFG